MSRKEFYQFESLPYFVQYPDNYSEGEHHPVFLFLHGAGTRGTDMEPLITNAFFKYAEEYAPEAICVAPLCAANTWFDVFETLRRFASAVSAMPFTDPTRLYLAGNSMGGYGTWQLAMSMPELFAAILPICGGGMYWNAARLKEVPVWAFHGAKDSTVFLAESEHMVTAVNKSGGSAKLTVYPENGHNSWTDTFKNPEVYRWLLSHRKGETTEASGVGSDGYQGKAFG
jgi:predicted peptidase